MRECSRRISGLALTSRSKLWRDIGSPATSSPAAFYGDVLCRMYRAIAAVSGAAVIVDSTKLPAHALVADAYANVDLYVLHLVRDPRAIAYSWLRNPDAAGRSGRSNLPFRGKGVIESTTQWMFFGFVADSFLRRQVEERYLLLRYEDFAARPREVTERIYQFIGQSPSWMPFRDERTAELGNNHIIGGNRSRFRRGTVSVVADHAWTDAMSRSACVGCTCLGWPLMKRFGYPLIPPGRRTCS